MEGRGLQDMGLLGGTKGVHPEEGSALGIPNGGVKHNVRRGGIAVGSQGRKLRCIWTVRAVGRSQHS